LRREVKALKKELLKLQIPEWRNKMESLGGVSYLSMFLEDADADVMRSICNDLTGADANSFIFLLARDSGEEKVRFMAAFGKDAATKLDIKKLATLLREHGLRGGGKGLILQGGGVAQDLKLIKKSVRDFVQG